MSEDTRSGSEEARKNLVLAVMSAGEQRYPSLYDERKAYEAAVDRFLPAIVAPLVGELEEVRSILRAIRSWCDDPPAEMTGGWLLASQVADLIDSAALDPTQHPSEEGTEGEADWQYEHHIEQCAHGGTLMRIDRLVAALREINGHIGASPDNATEASIREVVERELERGDADEAARIRAEHAGELPGEPRRYPDDPEFRRLFEEIDANLDAARNHLRRFHADLDADEGEPGEGEEVDERRWTLVGRMSGAPKSPVAQVLTEVQGPALSEREVVYVLPASEARVNAERRATEAHVEMQRYCEEREAVEEKLGEAETRIENLLKPLVDDGRSIESLPWDDLLGVAVRNLNECMAANDRAEKVERERDSRLTKEAVVEWLRSKEAAEVLARAMERGGLADPMDAAYPELLASLAAAFKDDR